MAGHPHDGSRAADDDGSSRARLDVSPRGTRVSRRRMDALDAEERVTVGVASHAILWLLLPAPLFVWSAWRRARAAGICRAAAWSLLVVVLAGPFVIRDHPAAGVCVVAAIDVSTSVQNAAVATAG